MGWFSGKDDATDERDENGKALHRASAPLGTAKAGWFSKSDAQKEEWRQAAENSGYEKRGR